MQILGIRRVVKIPECAEGSRFSVMDIEDEQNHMGTLFAYVTGLVNQELLLQNEYLATENRIWKARLQPGLRLSDGERATLAEIGKRLGRKGLQQVAHRQTRYHS